jgi:hypothetical protein
MTGVIQKIRKGALSFHTGLTIHNYSEVSSLLSIEAYFAKNNQNYNKNSILILTC